MPKLGYKSITVTDIVYDNFKTRFLKKKDELTLNGISSFSGFITQQLTEKFNQEDA